MANGSSTDPVAIRICFVESKGDTAFDSIRGLGAAVLGGVVLGPPGMVAAGVSYLALRKSNILKGPDAEKFESLMARKEQLDKRLEKNQIDMETIKKAATRAKSTTSSQLRQTNSEIVKAAAASADERNATSSFVGFAKAFLENNEAIDELAAQVKKDTGTRKIEASEESGISANGLAPETHGRLGVEAETGIAGRGRSPGAAGCTAPRDWWGYSAYSSRGVPGE